MRHHDGRQRPGAQALGEKAPHVPPDGDVERRQRLVEQERARSRGQRAGQGHPLRLAARKLGGAPRRERLGVELAQRLARQPQALGAVGRRDPVGDVGEDVEVGEEGVPLRQKADAALLDREVEAARGVEERRAVERDAPAARSGGAEDHHERLGLPRAVRADDHQRRARGAEGDVDGSAPAAPCNPTSSALIARSRANGDQQREGDRHQHDRQALRRAQVRFERRVDGQRQRLRSPAHVAGEHQRRAELAERARPAHRRAARQAGPGDGDGDGEEEARRRRAQRARHQHQIGIEAAEGRDGRLEIEGRGHERLREDDRRARERQADPRRRQRGAEQAAAPEGEQQRHARDRGRQHDRQLDDGLEDAPDSAGAASAVRRAISQASGVPHATITSRLTVVVKSVRRSAGTTSGSERPARSWRGGAEKSSPAIGSATSSSSRPDRRPSAAGQATAKSARRRRTRARGAALTGRDRGRTPPRGAPRHPPASARAR